jgi:hypothetical protein
MDAQTLPIVPFGKHKGQPITTLLNDTKYLEWCKQSGMLEKYPIIYNICVNQTITTTNENSKTPEHNKLQNLFLDKGNQHNLLLNVFKKRYGIIEDKLQLLFADEEFISWFGTNSIPEYKLDKSSVMFEDKFNWDLTLYYKGSKSITIESNPETESKYKIQYMENYDIEQQKLFNDKISLYDKKIAFREMIDIENYEIYQEKYEIYQKEEQNWRKTRENAKIEITNRVCKGYKISQYKIDIEVENLMNEYDRSNVKPKCPEAPNKDTSTYPSDKYDEHKNLFEFDRLSSVSYLKREKAEFEKKYFTDYEKNFIIHYEEHISEYYKNMISKYFTDEYMVVKNTGNRHDIEINICIDDSSAICCELKPALSDDYPCVLRKLKTQLELTKNDKTTFEKFHKNYALIIGSFKSKHTTKDQLISIFKQSKIIIIFTDELFDNLQSETRAQQVEQIQDIIQPNRQEKLELAEENKKLTDTLLKTQEKLLQAEEKIKQLEEEMQSLKTQKQSKSIKDYYGKN